MAVGSEDDNNKRRNEPFSERPLPVVKFLELSEGRRILRRRPENDMMADKQVNTQEYLKPKKQLRV